MKRFIAAVTIATLAGLVYVYEEVEAVKVGYEIRKLEEKKVQLLDRQRALNYNIARLKAPGNLERRLQSQKILLESPQKWETIVLPARPNARNGAGKVPAWASTPFFGKLFVGTAQAEAKEQSRR